MIKKRETRALIYVRLSSYRGETDPSTSPQRQEEACRAYALAHDWEVVDVVSDLDVSGSDKGLRLERLGLEKIREKWGTFDVLIFSKLDRLARNVGDFNSFADECKEHGVALVSVEERLDLSTPGGKAMAIILSVFAQLESDTVAERVTNSMIALRAMNRYGGGNCTYGYQSVPNPNGNGYVLEINPTEAKIVKEMASWILDDKKSLYSLMLDLNARGIPTRRINKKKTGESGSKVFNTWSVKTLTQLLTSEAIQGRVVHKGKVLRDENEMPRQLWPAVLDSDTVSRLRGAINQTLKPGVIRQRSDRSRLLSGLACCAECGHPLYQKISNRGRPTSYDCPTRSGGGNCSGCSVSADRLEEYVEAAFLERYAELEVMELKESGASEIELAEVERSIKTTLAEMDDANDEEYDLLSDRAKTLRARRTEIAREPRESFYVNSGRVYGEEWKSVEKRRGLLAANIVSLTVRKGVPGKTGPIDPERVNIKWLSIFKMPGGAYATRVIPQRRNTKARKIGQ